MKPRFQTVGDIMGFGEGFPNRRRQVFSTMKGDFNLILKLDRTETAVLLYHLSLMRKSVRNTFKSNHKKESKGLLASYDEIKHHLECFIQQADKDKETFHFNVKETRMLHSFLSSYIGKLEKTLQRTGGIMVEDQKQVDCLKDIEQRASALLGVVN